MRSLSKQTERWAIGALVVVCLALVVSMVWKVFASPVPPVSAAQPAAAGGAKAGLRGPGGARPAGRDELERYNPELNLALLKQIETHALPKTARNPFEYPPPPAAKVTPAVVTAPPPAPPPPPPSIKAIGYSVKPGNVAEAIVTDEQDLYVVHVGDTFAKRYHVLSISPDRIDIQDDTTQQTVHLPIAQ
jgi:hypothetical protein